VGIDDEELGATGEYIPPCYSGSLTSFPLVMERPPSRRSTLTDTSAPDSLFSKISEASEAQITETSQMRPDPVPGFLFSPVLDHVRELKHPPAPLLHLGDNQHSPPASYPGSNFSILHTRLGHHRPTMAQVQWQQPNNGRRRGARSTRAAPI
jgi:hypothetical protein